MTTSRSRRLLATLTLALTGGALSIAGTGRAATAALDPGFGSAGRADVHGVSSDFAVDLARVPGGGMVGVSTVVTPAQGTDGVVFRLGEDGRYDADFGLVHLDIKGANDVASSVAVQPDGKILVGGRTSENGDGTVWRLLPSGVRDGSFGAMGLAELDNGGYETVLDVAAFPFGRVVAVGATTYYGSSDRTIWRLKTDGTPDTTWNTVGTQIWVYPGFDTLRRVLVRPDSRIVATGVEAGQPLDVWGYDVVGNLDKSFHPDGHVTVPGTLPSGVDMAFREDGSVVVAGVDASSTDIRVAHLDGDHVDPTFGGPSGARLDLGGSETVNTVLPLAAGRVLVSGRTSTGGGRAFLALLGRDGGLDPVFGDGGVVYPGDLESVTATAVQSDGDVIAAGPVSELSTDALVLRYLDPTVAHPTGGGGQIGSSVSCAGRPATIVGTPGGDRLKGTQKSDVIVALAGDDRVKGLGGNDVVCGGDGNDKVSGGMGKDRLYGEGGKDRLAGGTGKDRLAGGPQHDEVRP